ncbi:energy transducer TonB [Desulfobulbus propionicus]
MSTQGAAFQLSLLLHLAIVAALFAGREMHVDETPPLVIDLSQGLAEARPGEPNQPPGRPAAPAKTPAPRPNAVEKPEKAVRKPVQQPVRMAKKTPFPRISKLKTGKVRNEPSPLVETGNETASTVAKFPSSSSSVGASASETTVSGSKGGQSSATTGAGAKGDNRGSGTGMRYDFDSVRQRILQNLRFPPIARKMGLTGKIVVSFALQADGQVKGVSVISSSGYEILDTTVVDTIRRVAPFPKPPVSARLVLPIVFHLK